MKDWYSAVVYGVPAATTVMGLTVDHWCVLAAITGTFCSIISLFINIYFRHKKEQREARENGLQI